MNLLFQGAQQTYDNPAFSGFGMQDSYRSSRWLASFTGLKQTYLWVHAVNMRHRCDTNLFSWVKWALWDLVRAKRACGKLQPCEEGRCSLRVSRKPSPRSTLSDPRNVPLSVIRSIMWLLKCLFMEKTKWISTCLSWVSIPIPLLLVFPRWFITMLCMFLMACCIVVISSLKMEILWELSRLPFFTSFHNQPQWYSADSSSFVVLSQQHRPVSAVQRRYTCNRKQRKKTYKNRKRQGNESKTHVEGKITFCKQKKDWKLPEEGSRLSCDLTRWSSWILLKSADHYLLFVSFHWLSQVVSASCFWKKCSKMRSVPKEDLLSWRARHRSTNACMLSNLFPPRVPRERAVSMNSLPESRKFIVLIICR